MTLATLALVARIDSPAESHPGPITGRPHHAAQSGAAVLPRPIDRKCPSLQRGDVCPSCSQEVGTTRVPRVRLAPVAGGIGAAPDATIVIGGARNAPLQPGAGLT